VGRLSAGSVAAAGVDGRSGDPGEVATDEEEGEGEEEEEEEEEEEAVVEWVDSSARVVCASAAGKRDSAFKRVSVLVLAEDVRGFRSLGYHLSSG
jgi:hypothetical protein